ncbi:MAG: hypothetical protein LBJ60_08730 [Tannerellaceae bacterium]|jgi:hypothetical protein|nr:hypothetical protein [Tannerellaceae bacterium]
MSVVHAARPGKNIYFTEQMLTERAGSETIHIAAPVKNTLKIQHNGLYADRVAWLENK